MLIKTLLSHLPGNTYIDILIISIFLIRSIFFFLDTTPIYVHSADPADFSDVSVNMLNSNFSVREDNFKDLPPESVVILDDFQLRSKQNKLDFLRVINVTLRHNKITLIMVVHNLFGNMLYNDIIYAPHLFLSCSNIGLSILLKIYMRMGGLNVLNFYHNAPKFNFQFLYINSKKNYLINNVQQLFDRTCTNVTMFTNQQEFVIHPLDQLCGPSDSTNNPAQSISSDVNDLLLTLYPKQKSLHLVTKSLLKKNALDQDLCFRDEPNVHLADFLRFINNKFDKSEKPETQMLRLCKQLQLHNIRFAYACIKNPIAKRYLC